MSVGQWRRSLGELSRDGQVGADDLNFMNQFNVFLDYSQDHADLGAALNGFSLNENDELSGAIEKTGQAIDVTYISTTKLVNKLLCLFLPFF